MSDQNTNQNRMISESGPKFCQECGISFTGVTKFCPECGIPINHVQTLQSVTYNQLIQNPHNEEEHFTSELSRRIKPSAVMWFVVASFQAMIAMFSLWSIVTILNLSGLIENFSFSSLLVNIGLFTILSVINFTSAARDIGLSSFIRANPLSTSAGRIYKTYSSSGIFIITVVYNSIIFINAAVSGSFMAMLIMLLAVVASVIELAYVCSFANKYLPMLSLYTNVTDKEDDKVVVNRKSIRLKQYEQLRAEGVISEAEFLEKTKDLTNDTG